MKPRSTGGLTKLCIPDPQQPSQWITITDPNLMDHHLLEYCQHHFSNSHGTPFTVPPLTNLLKYDGLTPFGSAVIQGTADLDDLNINHSTRLLLKHQKSCTPANIPRFKEMPYDALMQGICKWKERTTTSPSGWHLGIYKALLKDDHQPKKKKTNPTAWNPHPPTTTTTTPPTTNPERNGSDVMQMIHKLLVMAVHHCHTFERWTKILEPFYRERAWQPTNRYIENVAHHRG